MTRKRKEQDQNVEFAKFIDRDELVSNGIAKRIMLWDESNKSLVKHSHRILNSVEHIESAFKESTILLSSGDIDNPELRLNELVKRGFLTVNELGSFDIERPFEVLCVEKAAEKDLEIRVITTKSEFELLKPAWDSLTDEPLRSFEWNFCWWNSFSNNCELQIYCVEREGKVVGIAPFFIDRWMGCSRLRFTGSGSTCTDYAQVIANPSFREATISAIAAHIQSSTKPQLIELEGVSGPNPQAHLQSCLSKFWSYRKELQPTWVLRLPRSWEEFLASSKHSLRRKIRKAEKRLSSGEVTARSTADGMEFEEAFDLLVKLHQERFESKGEPGVFRDDKFTDFLRSAVKSLCEKHRAEIIVAEASGTPIAAQLYLIGDSGPQLYQAGVAVEQMHLEPGHLLFTFAIRRAIENGHTVFDFLRGSEAYKPFWGAEPEQTSTIRLVSRGFLPTVLNQAYRALRKAKHFTKNLSAKNEKQPNLY